MKRTIALLVAALFASSVFAQSAVIRGETATPGTYEVLRSTSQALHITGTVTSTPSGTQNVSVTTALPTGANTIGNVTMSGTPAVTVTSGTITVNALPTGTNSIGQVTSNPGISSKATYTAVDSIAMVALATDVCTLTGSASKTVRVTSIMVTGSQTTTGLVYLKTVKRAAADSGGTSTALTIVPSDSADGAGTAVARSYTANPTINSTVGNVYNRFVIFATAATGATTEAVQMIPPPVEGGNKKPITLRGAAEQIAVNVNGVTVTGGTIQCSFEWTEE